MATNRNMASSPSKKTRNGYPKGVFRQVFVCPKQELAPFGIAFATGADNFEKRKLGTIFGVVKLDDRSEDSSYVANLLVSVMKKEYFSKPQRSAEESFEAGLRKANLALAELARHGSLGWSGKLNFAGGTLERNNLHFACLGKVFVFLFRGGQVAEISRDLQEGTETETHPLKTFSNISSGKLEKGDKLIFTTDDLLEIFSKEELRQNADHFSREEFPGFVEMSLEANAELAGTVVVDLVEALEAKPAAIEAPVIGKEKISAISGSQPKTDQPLAGAYKSGGKKIDSFGRIHQKKPATAPGVPPSERGTAVTFWQKSGMIAKNALFYASEAAKKALKKAGRLLSAAKDGFPALDASKKKLFVGILAGVIAAAAVGLIAVSMRNKKPSPPAPGPESNPSQSQSAPALDDVQARAVENVEELAALPEAGSRFAILGDSLYEISGKDKTVMKINIASKTTENISSNLSTDNFKLIAAMPDLNSLFILTEDRKVVTFTPINKNFQENGISLPANLQARDIKSYLTYLYVLDPAGNQVYRYPRAEGGFGDRQDWLKPGADVNNAVGFAVNGDLFIANGSQITAYLQGKKDDKINFESPNVPLAIDDIFTDPDLKNIYVLDNKDRRVVAYSKDGKIAAQYLNDSISAVKDFSVDEKNKNVFLLKNNQVLKFSVD